MYVCMCIVYLVLVQGGESAIVEAHRDEPGALVHLAHHARHKLTPTPCPTTATAATTR